VGTVDCMAGTESGLWTTWQGQSGDCGLHDRDRVGTVDCMTGT